MIIFLLVLLKMVLAERTVIVTPRPRWLPTNFVYEPKDGDPSNPNIPALVPFRTPVYNLKVIGPNGLLSAALPVEHRHQQKGVDGLLDGMSLQRLSSSNLMHSMHPGAQLVAVPHQRALNLQPIVVSAQQGTASSQPGAGFTQQPIIVAPISHLAAPFTKRLQQGNVLPTSSDTRRRRPNYHHGPPVYVESVPSVTLKSTDENPAEDKDLLPDYLTPPKYPSVYEQQSVEKSSAPDIIPIPKKKKKNKKIKQKVEEPAEKGGGGHVSDNEIHKFRTQSSGERVEFQLHGQSGPESYKFGFDTGAGKNRQFRYEEKDADGNVKGHFGYYDTTGKLQMFNYRADKNGFHAEQVE